MTILDRPTARRHHRRGPQRRCAGLADHATATWRARSTAAAPRSGIDLLLGIGGTPEGVIAAAALKCLGGAIQGRLWPRDDDERRTLVDDGLRPGRGAHDRRPRQRRRGVLRRHRHHRRLICCAACRYWPDGATTYSMVMRSRSGTVRWVEARASVRETRTILRPSRTGADAQQRRLHGRSEPEAHRGYPPGPTSRGSSTDGGEDDLDLRSVRQAGGRNRHHQASHEATS